MSAASDILQELLAAMPDSYQKTIGFPTYDLLAAAALRMEGTDAELEAAKARLDPENLTGDEMCIRDRPLTRRASRPTRRAKATAIFTRSWATRTRCV